MKTERTAADALCWLGIAVFAIVIGLVLSFIGFWSALFVMLACPVGIFMFECIQAVRVLKFSRKYIESLSTDSLRVKTDE